MSETRGSHFAQNSESAGGVDAPLVNRPAAGKHFRPTLKSEDAQPLPPRPSDSPTSAAGNAVCWLAAAFGAAGVVLVAQLVVGAVVGVVVGMFLLANNPGADTEALIEQLSVPMMLLSQLGSFIIFLPWWLHLKPVAFVPTHARERTAGRIALALVAIVVLGLGIQMLTSYALTFLLPLFPDVQAEYTEVMDTPAMNEFTLFAVVSLAIGAPVTEELAVRGVVFEFCLRAVCPQWAACWRDRRWRKRTGEPMPDLPPVPSARFWTANVLQAALFGLLHLNVAQGLYAFVAGLVCGWIVWKSGNLLFSMAAHLVVNFSSYFVAQLSGILEFSGVMPAIAISAAMVVFGLGLFSVSMRGDEGQRSLRDVA